MGRAYSAALPIAYILLRILIVLNWVLGLCIAGLLAYTFINEAWTMRGLGIIDHPEPQRVLGAMRAVAALGLASIPVNHVILAKLVAIVTTVRAGDPFVAANAERLRTIAWALVALQLVGMIIGAIGEAISTPAHPVDLDSGFSISGWLAVLLTFILARVFAEGTMMREDLEGTI